MLEIEVTDGEEDFNDVKKGCGKSNQKNWSYEELSPTLGSCKSIFFVESFPPIEIVDLCHVS